MSIRWLCADDNEQLKTCYQLHQSGQPYPWSFSVIQDMLSHPYRIGVIEEQNQLVAYMVVLVVANEMTVMDIVVSAECRGMGHGKALLQCARQYAMEKDCSTIFLEVRESNYSAIALYRKCAFEVIDVRKRYYPGAVNKDDKEDAIIMALSLAK